MEDRISSLLDDVVHLIISFLQTKFAVQTSLLSKRWRYLWTAIPSLHLDESSFANNPSSFINFSNHVFSHRDPSKTIRHFRISYETNGCYVDKLFLDFLFTHGRGIQDFYLSASPYPSVDQLSQPFLDHLLTWDSLKTSTLENVLIPTKKDLNFVSLTTLHLISYFKMILSFPKLSSFCFEAISSAKVVTMSYETIQAISELFDYGDGWEFPKMCFSELVMDLNIVKKKEMEGGEVQA
ncbi:F-box/LRR-repeat protein 25-like [Senna tora]|uniref:F-box/LRR-repeat protein 25-like n=1 Tax=Senna tora TaxID=362788 RepID=A0A834XEE5_9FABA|nr:F-box/LRR-repeat protein 25-like [Senna tora]